MDCTRLECRKEKNRSIGAALVSLQSSISSAIQSEHNALLGSMNVVDAALLQSNKQDDLIRSAYFHRYIFNYSLRRIHKQKLQFNVTSGGDEYVRCMNTYVQRYIRAS